RTVALAQTLRKLPYVSPSGEQATENLRTQTVIRGPTETGEMQRPARKSPPFKLTAIVAVGLFVVFGAWLRLRPKPEPARAPVAVEQLAPASPLPAAPPHPRTASAFRA